MGGVLPQGAGVNAEVEHRLLAQHVWSASSVRGPLMDKIPSPAAAAVACGLKQMNEQTC